MCSRFPALDKVRFVNSGTEANVYAINTARAVTGRPGLMAFSGSYHGGVLSFPGKAAVLNVPFDTVLAPYNDTARTLELIEANATELAAVIMEPMVGSGGCIRATDEFIQAVRQATERHGILLIFDEVMTSRLAPGGLHSVLGVKPDLLALGKYLGGGLSFGAFGGRADIMDRFDPARPGAFAHAGTFNNNVLSMAAGLCGLTQVLTEAESLRINALGDQLRTTLNQRLAELQLEAIVLGRGSVMNLHFSAGPIETPAQLGHSDARLLQLWQLEMLHRGQFVTPRGMIVLSLPFTQAVVDQFIAAFDDFLDTNLSLLQNLA
jgi:glutamate-1-semialdehyde 2,1-aminomutase